MLGWRLVVSAIVLPALIAVFYFDHRSGSRAPLLLALVILLALRSAFELVHLLRTRSMRPSLLPSMLGAGAVAASAWLHEPWGIDPQSVAGLGPIALVFTGCVLVLFFKAIIRYQQPGDNAEALSTEILTVVYCGLLLAVTAQLRWVRGAEVGYIALGSLIAAAKCGDIGAYTLGRLFGKRKMAPRLSPGKTWAGGLGALLGSAIGAVAWMWIAARYIAPPDHPLTAWYWIAIYGAVIGVVGLIGDLCESLIKRDVGKKDAAALMPGFGGLLDLLDSVLYAGPVAYAAWLAFPLL